MKTNPIYMSDLHFEHKVWTNEFKFYHDEIDIFESRLEDIVSKNSDRDMLAKVEHFQNQFIRQKEVHDEVMHEINKHEDALKQFAIDNPVAVNHVHFRDHGKLRDDVFQFRRIYSDLRKEFVNFMAEWI